MKLRIHAGSTIPSSVCTLMHDFDDTVGSEYCCRVQCSALCSGDCVVDRVSVFQKLMMLVLIVLCFNDIYGSSMKI